MKHAETLLDKVVAVNLEDRISQLATVVEELIQDVQEFKARQASAVEPLEESTTVRQCLCCDSSSSPWDELNPDFCKACWGTYSVVAGFIPNTSLIESKTQLRESSQRLTEQARQIAGLVGELDRVTEENLELRKSKKMLERKLVEDKNEMAVMEGKKARFSDASFIVSEDDFQQQSITEGLRKRIKGIGDRPEPMDDWLERTILSE